MLRRSNGSLNVFMRPLPWIPMPDLGQVDIFGSDILDAPSDYYYDEDSDYESESGSESEPEFGSESEFEYEVVVTRGTGEPSWMQEVQQMAEMTEEMQGVEDMEIEGKAEEMDHLLPHETQLRQQEEEEAVRNAIERRETLIRENMDPNLASNFDYDYNSTDEEDDNADEHLHNHLLHSREFSSFLSTLI
ncbi:hypothetical protein B9Z19DRAFT_1074350 [Tuber borchii]|uniref:Uncharacterized protein n=1 Tax=Tuber borchii TaxID=42251 RepID=A0A2T7A4R2_TUBBO|nr:hypothetical protein B9Z19DRAFT_1074350 [Tuber borchii]